MIVKQTKTSADDGLSVRRPGEPYAWRKVVFLVEGGIVVPAQTRVYGEVVPDLPIVLKPEAVVVVAEMNLIILRSQSTTSEEQEEAGIDRAKLLVVGFGGEELIILQSRFDAVHFCVLIVPAEFNRMAIDGFSQTVDE